MKRGAGLLILLVCLSGLLAACGGGGGQAAPTQMRDPLDNWHLRTPMPQGNYFIDVVYGNGIFVALSWSDSSHDIWTSADGTDWIPRNSGVDSHLNSVIYANGKFVAVGQHGAIVTSEDGINWIKRSSGTGTGLTALTYGNGTFLAYGGEAVPFGHSYLLILASADGITWTQTIRDPGVGMVTFGNGTFVGIAMFEVSTSADGITWTKQKLHFDEPINDVTYANGLFVAVGDEGGIYTSGDGITWISRFRRVDASLWQVAYGDGTFVAVGHAEPPPPGQPDLGMILTSADGISWTFRNNAGIGPLSGVAYGNGTFIALGGNNIYQSGPVSGGGGTGLVQLGLEIDRSSLPGGTVNIPYSKIVFMKVSGGAPPYSYSCAVIGEVTGLSAALNFQDPTTGDAACEIRGTPLAAGEATVYFFARDDRDSASAGPLSVSIMPSPDPLDNWHVRSSLPEGNSLVGLAYGNGMFVASGYRWSDAGYGPGILATSSDGITWTSRDFGTALDLAKVAYGNGIFVVRGKGYDIDFGTEVILYSQDGVKWTAASLAVDGRISLSDMAYGNGTFVAVGSISNNDNLSGLSGIAVRSPDGLHWTRDSIISDFQGVTRLSGLTYGNGIFVAAGTLFTPSGPMAIIMTSPDGVAWTSKQVASYLDLHTVAYGNGIFVASGEASQSGVNTIMTSPDGITWNGASPAPVVWPYLGIGPIAFGDGVFVAGKRGGALYTSPDGMTWTYRIMNIPDLTGLTYGNGTFVAVTVNGKIIQSDPMK